MRKAYWRTPCVSTLVHGLSALPEQFSFARLNRVFDVQTFASGPIALGDLPKWSPWPARLLQLSEWKALTRDTKKVDSEYDKDKYLRCLNFLKEHPGSTPDDIRAFEQHLPVASLCVSQRNALYELPTKNIIPADNAMLVDVLAPLMAEADIVMELGCGYGYNLWELRRKFPEKTYIGGEYSPNAIMIAGMLYADTSNLTVEAFNYYDATYGILERCPPGKKILLFTRHSIEQLPSAKNVIDILATHVDRLAAVVHMDVAMGNYGDSLLDLLRKKYVTACDYNRDLLDLLQARQSDIEIFRNDHDVYGQNPLNPSAVIGWRSRKNMVGSRL